MYKLLLLLVTGFFVFILWIIYMANVGQSSIFFDLVRVTPYGDKIGHLFLFGLLTIGSNTAFRFKSLQFGPLSIYVGTLLVIVFVVAEELSQGFLPSRTLDAKDLLADGIGISIFTALSYFAQSFAKQ